MGRKLGKREILTAAKAAGLFGVARSRSGPAVRILCYHGLWLGDRAFAGDSMFMKPETFRRRLEIIEAQGYPVVSLGAAIAALRGDGPALPPSAVAITIDDGWYSTAKEMVPALAARGMPATLYCDTRQLLSREPVVHMLARFLPRIAAARGTPAPDDATAKAVEGGLRLATDLKQPFAVRLDAARGLGELLDVDVDALIASGTFDYMAPETLAKLHADGLGVQLHTHRHTLGDMHASTIAAEIADNRAALSDVLGRPPEAFTHFCYPSGVTSDEAARTLAGLGLASATTTEQHLAWPKADMHLLPRLLDGENMSEIEFEAELSGFGDWLRAARRHVLAARGLVKGRRLGSQFSPVARV